MWTYEDEVVLFSKYHRNHGNLLIHLLVIPIGFWGVLVCLTELQQRYCELSKPGESWANWSLRHICKFDCGLAMVAAYGIFYTLYDAVAGLSWTVCLGLPLWKMAHGFASQVDGAWEWGLGVYAFNWLMQAIPGHKILEGRKPKLIVTAWQEVATVKGLVWLMLLFKLGYRKDFQERVQERVLRDPALKAA